MEGLSLNSVPYFICIRMHTNTQLDQLANAGTEDGIKSDENGTTITVKKEKTYFCRSEDEK